MSINLASLNPQQVVFLLVAGILGGALNAAGAAALWHFRLCCWSACRQFRPMPPIPLPSGWASPPVGGAYRSRLDVPQRVLIPLLGTSFVGGIVGAFLLLKTPAHTFMRVLPWLMLGATLLFVFGKRLAGRRPSSVGHDATTAAIVGASIFELVVAVYGGYSAVAWALSTWTCGLPSA